MVHLVFFVRSSIRDSAMHRQGVPFNVNLPNRSRDYGCIAWVGIL